MKYTSSMCCLKAYTCTSKLLRTEFHNLTENLVCNSHTSVCPPVQGDNPQALGSDLSPAQADKLCYNYFIPPSSATVFDLWQEWYYLHYYPISNIKSYDVFLATG